MSRNDLEMDIAANDSLWGCDGLDRIFGLLAVGNSDVNDHGLARFKRIKILRGPTGTPTAIYESLVIY